MAIDPTSTEHANIKMKSDRVLAALSELPRKGAKGGIKKPGGIRKGRDSRSHFQGVAIRNGRAFLTLSGKQDGAIMVAQGSGRSFTHSRRVRISGFNHPGGIQTLGNYVAVPVYGHRTQKAFVHIYDRDLQLICAPELATRKAYCVGIANLNFDGGERYILAVVSQSKGDRVDFYKSPVNEAIDGNLTFEKHMTWERDTADTSTWTPDQRWDGHPNSISLIADQDDRLYLLGLNTTPKWRKASRIFRFFFKKDAITATGLGKDRAELYTVDLSASENQLTKVAHRKMKCHRPAFRWGASAVVTSESSFDIVACESEVFKKRSTKVDIDLFQSS